MKKLGVLFQVSRALEDTSVKAEFCFKNHERLRVTSERVMSVEVERVLEVKSGRSLLFGSNWPPGPVKEKIP